MNWHEPTADEIKGEGGYQFLIDISPDWVPHQAATDGDALFRVQKPGWAWRIQRQVLDKKGKRQGWQIYDLDIADTKEAAIGSAQAALGRLRA